MFFIPLSQIESVDLVIHALRAAGGEADCSTCPARKVCMKQCLTIAEAVTGMVASGSLPMLPAEPEPPPAPAGPEKGEGKKGHLKVLK
jgi:hypothetical protein